MQHLDKPLRLLRRELARERQSNHACRMQALLKGKLAKVLVLSD